jgi:polysaccharide pyruvyl transferase WcaK-like protein
MTVSLEALRGSPPAAGPQVAYILRRLAARRSRPLRVLVVGNYGNGNTGDEAVLAGLLPALTSAAEVTVVARRPAEVSRLHGVAAVQTTSRQAVRALLRTDVIAVGGGGMFGAGLPPLVAVLPFVLCAARVLLGKRLVFQAVGIYPDTPAPVLAALRVAAALSAGTLVRDASSVGALRQGRLARRLGWRLAPVLVHDPAIDVPAAPAEQARALLAAAGVTGAPLVVSVKTTPDPARTERMLAGLAAAADRWTNRAGRQVAILPLSVQGDYGLGAAQSDAMLAARVRALADCPDRIVVLPEGLSPALAKAVIGQAAGVIGVRLHAQIFAWSMGRPLLALPFEPKSRTFLEQVRLTGIELSELDDGRLHDWVDAL